MEFRGFIAPAVTCFDRFGRFAEALQRDLVKLLSIRFDGFSPCGTYGSGRVMSVAERKHTALDPGAVGVIADLANLFPECLSESYQMWKKKDAAATTKMQLEVVKAWAIMKYGPRFTMTYAMLRRRGVNPGYPRLPYRDIGKDLDDKVGGEPAAMGLL